MSAKSDPNASTYATHGPIGNYMKLLIIGYIRELASDRKAGSGDRMRHGQEQA